MVLEVHVILGFEMARKIVIVEDSPADAKILRLALAEQDPALEIVVLEDGRRAIDFFASAQKSGDTLPCDLILLDLNLPRVSGYEVLEFLKCDTELKRIPVVVLSGSSSQQDVERAYTCSANSYICKPVGIDEVFGMAAQLVTYWFECAKRPGSQRVLGA